MSTITKERVAGIASGEKCYTHDDVVELARIALASLEAEADYIRYDCGCCGWETLTDWRENDVCPKCNHHPMGKTELFTAPPAPVVSEIDRQAICDKVYGKCSRIPGATFYNAAEFALDEVDAAMLQGADGNSPVIPDGWAMVPVNATRAMIDAAARVEEDGYDAMLKAMLAAAPQQEVKNG